MKLGKRISHEINLQATRTLNHGGDSEEHVKNEFNQLPVALMLTESK